MSWWHRLDGRIIVDDGDNVYVIHPDDPDHPDNIGDVESTLEHDAWR
ncbi:hypothetical protein H0B56_08855 [Haloechinothrix sp. YIM 98757]|uniref:Uncharacterized protein n=1 Tax=Haloechinothrix aidingensis TaxID=2752311 RepID=A0A838A8G2_9PSEU|nr:hypothetical protein [Haloechinothrix aidingensis]MBA0125645.1 hypothetical protein [Haloechinothrix aidingensis]